MASGTVNDAAKDVARGVGDTAGTTGGADDLYDGLIPVNRVEDIPAFASEAEEQAFWDTHCFGEALLEQFQPVPLDAGEEWGMPPERAETLAAAPRTRPVSVRLDQDVLRRLKAVAGKKGKGYQSLLKEFVVERLYEEEKREGLLAS